MKLARFYFPQDIVPVKASFAVAVVTVQVQVSLNG